MSIRVAFASTDGRQVDQTFSDASCWWVYDIGENVSFIEKRPAVSAFADKSTNQPESRGNKLDDCDLLCVAGGTSSGSHLLQMGNAQIIPTYQPVSGMIQEIRTRYKRNGSMDYFRKVENLLLSYGMPSRTCSL